MNKGRHRVQQRVSIELSGKTYSGLYEIDRRNDLLRVSYGGDHKSTQLGGLRYSPELLARHLLRDLVERERQSDGATDIVR